MKEIELDETFKPSPNMKLFLNPFFVNDDLVIPFFTLSKRLNDAGLKLESKYLLFITELLRKNQHKAVIPLSHVLSEIVESELCKTTVCRNLLNHFFIAKGIFETPTVKDSNSDRIYPAITYSGQILDNLDSIIDSAGSNNLQVLKSEGSLSPALNKLNKQAIRNQISYIPSSFDIATDEKRVIAIKDNYSGLMNILVSVASTDKQQNRTGTMAVSLKQGPQEITMLTDYEVSTWTNSDSVMLFKDLKYYFAANTLTFHAHVARLNDYLYQKRPPVNRTHLHIDDILSLIYPNTKKGFGGIQRNECREALQRIRKTIVELTPHKQEEISVLKNALMQTGENDGDRPVTETEIKPFSKLARVEYTNSKGKFGASTMDYIVELPEVLFNSLFCEEFHWLMPPSILTVDDLFFALYLYLRTRMGQKGTYTFSFESFFLVNSGTGSSVSDFANRLKDALYSLSRSTKNKTKIFNATKTKYKAQYTLELYGYTCYIDCANEEISVTVDQKLFLAALELHDGRRTTPTISNPLANISFNELIQKKEFTEPELNSLANLVQMGKKHLTKTLQSTNRRLGHMIRTVVNEPGYIGLSCSTSDTPQFYITSVTSEQEIYSLATQLGDDFGMAVSDISEHLFSLQEKIDNKFLGTKLPVSVLEAAYRFYCDGFQLGDGSIKNQVELFQLAQKEPHNFDSLLSMCNMPR
ncbi:hypothetical protein HUO09_16810 [Vibrio sp. Y2-5]|uniref:replication initiator protein RctB domain-containing protein n=1 Tax=Vibrio sp. Y2-5 TaxID=2743977 RepID=UPI001661245C|nr:replication initiator protein RctB domain-containing protein [Vibrio sp. Y2-5]MBD0788016.1 hypothetical protein [Vibrio sp. Y2-5]